MPEFAAGTEIAGYRIESVIGRGGMAIVYRAEDSRLGRKVALKLLTPTLAENEAFQQRFIRESRLAASLDHPNIVPIYEAGEADGHLFIAMRYVPGSDLKALIVHGALPSARMLQLFVQIGDALDAAHLLGLVHRDVKPGNILVAPVAEPAGHGHSDHVYLTDFGLTKHTASLSGSLTGTGHFLGTVDYVAPEQIQGAPVGPQTDIYALGCVLYECLTGRLPFHRDDDAAVLWAHLATPPPPVSAARPDLPAEVNDVVLRAMAKEPEDRYDSCRELVRDLEYALNVRAEVPSLDRPPSRQMARHSRPLADPALSADQPPAPSRAVPDDAGSPGPGREDERRWVSHPSLPPGTIKPPAWSDASSGSDDDDSMPTFQMARDPDDPDDVGVELGPDVEQPPWEADDGEGGWAGQQTRRRPRWLTLAVVGALVAVSVIVGGVLLSRPRGPEPLQAYHSTTTLVHFSFSYPQSWTVLPGAASDVVFSPQPNAAGATFFQGSGDQWTLTSHLLQSSPSSVVGAYAFTEATGFDTSTVQTLQQAVGQLSPQNLTFVPGIHRQPTVGGATADELEADLVDPTSSTTRLHVMFDAINVPSQGKFLITFFAAPDQFAGQLPLFTRMRDSIRFQG